MSQKKSKSFLQIQGGWLVGSSCPIESIKDKARSQEEATKCDDGCKGKGLNEAERLDPRLVSLLMRAAIIADWALVSNSRRIRLQQA